jgi:hypothetical protein
MTATTTPDGLRYPDDPEAPADSINAFGQLAVDTQTALNARMPLAPTGGTLAVNGNFTAVGAFVARWGRLVVARGHFNRTTALTVADNGVYQFGTVPAGFRPIADVFAAGTWQALNGSSPQIMTTQVRVDTSGALSVVSNVAGSMRVNDYVSVDGLVWWTP